jgi:hypothetical protein
MLGPEGELNNESNLPSLMGGGTPHGPPTQLGKCEDPDRGCVLVDAW